MSEAISETLSVLGGPAGNKAMSEAISETISMVYSVDDNKGMSQAILWTISELYSVADKVMSDTISNHISMQGSEADKAILVTNSVFGIVVNNKTISKAIADY